MFIFFDIDFSLIRKIFELIDYSKTAIQVQLEA